MPRPRLKPGELGTIRFDKEPNGRVSGRARTRGLDGEVIYLRARGWSEEIVAADLIRSAATRSEWFVSPITADSALAELVDSCDRELNLDLDERPTVGRVELEALRVFVLPEMRELTLREMTVARIDQLLCKLLETQGHTRAREARIALFQLLNEAVALGAIARNPIRSVARLPALKGNALTPEQFDTVIRLLRKWKSPSRRVEDIPELEDAIELLWGTSASITDVLALRRRDVNIGGANPSVFLPQDTQQDNNASVRPTGASSMPRAIRGSTIRALERRLENTGECPEDFLFTTVIGGVYPRRRFDFLLEAFAAEHREQLGAIEVNRDRFGSEVFRGR